jgi:hypothetical protein
MDGGDVDMDTEGKTNAFNIDTDFLETRREQCMLDSHSDVSYSDAICRYYSQASVSYTGPDRMVYDRSRAERSRHSPSTSGTCFPPFNHSWSHPCP